jgi:hypothetical protein
MSALVPWIGEFAPASPDLGHSLPIMRIEAETDEAAGTGAYASLSDCPVRRFAQVFI